MRVFPCPLVTAGLPRPQAPSSSPVHHRLWGGEPLRQSPSRAGPSPCGWLCWMPGPHVAPGRSRSHSVVVGRKWTRVARADVPRGCFRRADTLCARAAGGSGRYFGAASTRGAVRFNPFCPSSLGCLCAECLSCASGGKLFHPAAREKREPPKQNDSSAPSLRTVRVEKLQLERGGKGGRRACAASLACGNCRLHRVQGIAKPCNHIAQSE